MQLNELSILSSERGVRAALRSLFYGSRSSLLQACANIKSMNATVERLRKDGYQDRANAILETPRYTTLKSAVDNAAIRCASIDAYANTLGVMLETDFNPVMQGGKTKEQMLAVSEATGIDVAKLEEIERKGIKSRYDRDADAQTDAEVAFYSSEANDELEIKADTVLRAFERERNRMLEWTNLDLSELTLMRHDIEVLERMVDYEEREVEPTEGSIDNEVAESLSKPKALSAIYEEYKREINLVRENQRKEEALEMRATAAGNPPADKPKGSRGGKRMTKAEHDATANA
jgi:hypothetical protein